MGQQIGSETMTVEGVAANLQLSNHMRLSDKSSDGQRGWWRVND